MEKKSDFCTIKISDNGIGIPDAIKDKLFEEGVSYGENKGMGLGLYIVKKTIERYGGEVSFENNVPKGTTFILKLKKSL
jgi:signal transduction histidine kinase